MGGRKPACTSGGRGPDRSRAASANLAVLLAQEVFSLSPGRLDVTIADVFRDQADYPIFIRNTVPIGRNLELQSTAWLGLYQDAPVAAPAGGKFRDTAFHAGRHICEPFLRACAQLRFTKRSHGTD